MIATSAQHSKLLPAGGVADARVSQARAIIAKGSKSFALASALLPREVQDGAVVLYAWCRRVDDAIDDVSADAQPAALAALRSELDHVYGGREMTVPMLAAFQALVHERRIPRLYADELLAGMAMDVSATRYADMPELLRYCYRVAGTVGLMMCHVMGVRGEQALIHAAHLGMAMQLTNIARDVLEDWERGRLYLPDELLEACGAPGLRARIGEPLPAHAGPAVARATDALLRLADRYYASGDAGLPALSPRCAFGVRAARLIYARIGCVLRARGCDPFSGRAVVPLGTKLALALRAGLGTLGSLPRAGLAPRPHQPETLLPWRDALAPGVE